MKDVTKSRVKILCLPKTNMYFNSSSEDLRKMAHLISELQAQSVTFDIVRESNGYVLTIKSFH